MDRRDAKEVITWVLTEIRKQLYPYTTDGKLDLGKFNQGSISRIKGWEDLQTPSNSLRLDGTNPPVWTPYKSGQVLAFEDQAVNYQVVYWVWQLPHSYKLGSAIYPHIHTVPEDNTAGNVYWEFTYSIAAVNDAFPVATSIFLTQVQPEVTDKHTYTSFDAIPGSALPSESTDISTMIICSLARRSDDVLDTFTGKDVYLLEVDLHYERDTTGSYSILVK